MDNKIENNNKEFYKLCVAAVILFASVMAFMVGASMGDNGDSDNGLLLMDVSAICGVVAFLYMRHKLTDGDI